MHILLIFTALLYSGFGHAKPSCPEKITKTLTRPTGEGNKTFPYTYEYRCKDPALPTVIYIPGGPGSPSIGTKALALMNANVIATDPRGAGINAAYWSQGGKENDLSTERVADDIIAIIKSRRLKNYTLHGSSFGTAVATVVASKLEKSKSPYLPNSIILEGVVGRAEKDGEQSAATNQQFQKIKTEAGFCLTCRLDALRGALSSTEIGTLVETLQSFGTDYATKALKNASDEELVALGRESAVGFGPNEKRVYHAIACREYFPKGITMVPYRNGELQKPTDGSCDGQKFDRAFDSKAWQVKTKTFYVVGTADNYTPTSQARYHFESQANSNKSVICVSKGGHGPLKYNMPACATQVYSKMIAGRDLATTDILNCSASLQTEKFNCGP